MASSHEQVVGQIANALKDVCDVRIKEIEDFFQSRFAEIEVHIDIVTAKLRTSRNS